MPKLKKWILKDNTEVSDDDCQKITERFGIEPVISRLLAVRGYDTEEKVRSFLNKENTYLYDPFLMKDMDRAAARIVSALDKGEKITIYGDYDVDGVTSVSVIYLYLKSRGGNVSYYIPNRASEGYGLNNGALNKLKEEGTSLVVTVDTGITAVEETEYMKSIGLDLVVTDHHGCREILPDACAVVNPKRPDDGYPFKELAGVGVVFKTITAVEFLLQERKIFGDCGNGLSYGERYTRMLESGESDFLETVCRDYIDLVAIGTVADVMTLTDENRLICSAGLSIIENSPRPGLAALMDASEGMKAKKYPKKRKLSASYIGFTVAPRINAAGRIADAELGVELFICEDRKEADRIASELCELNLQRQAEENRIALEAAEMAEKTHDFENDPVIVLASENWHHGVIGIVSSRLTEKYNMPSILISVEDGVGKGSGRSIKGLHICHALAECSDLLIRYGGHELAAGLTVSQENIDSFRKKINEYARAQLGSDAGEINLDVDLEIEEEDVSLRLCEQMSLLEPCGVGNPTPVFMMRNVTVEDVTSIGDGKHTKLTLGEKRATALVFGTTVAEADLERGDVIDVVFRLDVNEFRNVKTEQMIVVDARIPEAAEFYGAESAFLEKAEGGAGFTAADRLLPDRDDFAAVFREVRSYPAEGQTVSFCRLHGAVTETAPEMRPAKLKLALKILADVGLISFEQLPICSLSGTELYRIASVKYAGKVNLFGAPRYKNLKKQLV
ncbi:MAG: single-stranded-DNA-specific exonuclease RecJ [Ruminococcaceae bacterium]|nr:single-stranded-DNA-specific exonuclease RecJ [Oscillospiraceae bacterium]